MASNETVKPKGILKHSSSLDQRDSISNKEMTWDEMNILATHHPSDKDYGHMKINEPPTPYSKYSDVEEDDLEGERRGSVGENVDIDPSSLASRLTDNTDPKILQLADDDDNDDDDDDEQEVDQEYRHNFELKRKLHYNEYQAVQLAKKLMSEEEEVDDEEEEDESNVISSDKMDHSQQENSNESNEIKEK